MLVSFVIVNYNTRELLRDCIRNLLNIQTQIPETEIIVVDNLSFDGSDQMMETEFKDKVVFVKNTINNLPQGHNLGYQASKGEYVLHLGSDCYPTADAILKISYFMEQHLDVGVCTGKLVTKDGKMDWDAHRGLTTPWVAFTHFSSLDKLFPKVRAFNGYSLNYLDFSIPHEIDVCISHFMFVRRGVYEKIGLWSTAYFMYGEDIDFCYRVKQAGFKIMYLPSVEITHLKGGGVGRKSSDGIDNSSRRDYNHMKKVRAATSKSMLIFYNTHLAKNYPFFVNWLVFVGIYLLSKYRAILFAIKGNGY